MSLDLDSNIVKNFTRGIYAAPQTSNNLRVRYNQLDTLGQLGINIQGDSGVFTDNIIISSIVGGNGISINGNGGANVSRNKILGVTAGSGIVVNAPNSLVANNYVQSDGVGLARGISLDTGGSGSDVVFNSVNVTGTDVVNGQGITVNGGTNYRARTIYLPITEEVMQRISIVTSAPLIGILITIILLKTVWLFT